MTDQRPGTDLAYAAAMPAPQGGALPTGLEWQALERMATMLAESDVIPYRLKRKPADVAVILLAAREYGIPPLMALSKLPVVNGTPAPMGELMVALVLRAGHYIGADFRNPDGTVYKGGPLTPQHYGEARYKRRDWTDREVMTFTLEEALTAGLIDTIRDGRAIARVTKTKNGQQVEEVTPWEQYTPNMARWRAVANAARLAFPDVLLGLSYLPEELGAVVDAEGAPILGEVVDDTPRRRATTAASLEERSALEAADRLAEFAGPLEVLDKVLAHAEANGYADTRIEYADRQTGEQASSLREAIAIRRAWLEANTVPEDTRAQEVADAIHAGQLTDLHYALAKAEADGIADHVIRLGGAEGPLRAYIEQARPHVEAHRQQAASEAPSAPQAAEEPPTEAPTPTGQPEAPSEAPSGGLAGPELALECARAVLEEGTSEGLRQVWQMADEAGVLDVDVIGVVGDDDLSAVALEGTVRLPLGALIMRAKGYVEKHGAAIRDLGEPTPAAPVEEEPVDPWATDPQQA